MSTTQIYTYLHTLSLHDALPIYAGLMARHREAVYRLARAHGGENDAMDIVQASFIAAFDALRRYDSAKPFRPWLLRIALNKCRDRADRKSTRLNSSH